MAPRQAYSFQPCGGNSFELLAGGRCFYPRLIEAIAGARQEVLVASYVWENDKTGREFLGLAADAARRGADVRLMLDGVGGRNIGAAQRRIVQEVGGEVEIYHPVRWGPFSSRLFRRNHRKLVLIDGEFGFIGGAGFADAWTADPPREWWDLMFRVAGPVVAHLRKVFAHDWRKCGGRPLLEARGGAIPSAGRERLWALPSKRRRPELLRQLTHAIRHSVSRVWLCCAYFVPPFRLRAVLRSAARRGVDVRLILPGSRTDHVAVWSAGRRYYRSLLARGVRLFEWQRSLMHSKYALVDDAWGYVGSSNLDHWSGRYNLELDLSVHSPQGLGLLAGQFEEDLVPSREITVERWNARPVHHRLMEQVFGWIDPLL